jgi:hypothetical protein
LLRDAELFREYALAFKGARQLTWSRGLKARFGLDDVDDAELTEAEPPAEIVAFVHERVVRRLASRKMLPALLEVAEAGGTAAIEAFVMALDDAEHSDFRPPPRRTAENDPASFEPPRYGRESPKPGNTC